MNRYLTKSRFKLALECETKLYYTRKKEYADQSIDDPFLMELAKGGYQVGELAKFYFSDNANNITVHKLDYHKALEDTKNRIARGNRYIAEAAIQHENLFIRVDIFEMDAAKKEINLFEVKSKSYDSKTNFFTYKRGTQIVNGINGKWKSYLYDVAFQKYVVSKAYPDFKINTFLTLINKDAVSSVDGLNQLFKVRGTKGNFKVIVPEKLTKEQLGKKILVNVPVDEQVDYIWNNPVESKYFPEYDFEKYIRVVSDHYQNDTKIETPISKACRKCQFFAKTLDVDKGLKSGLKECWTQKLKISDEKFAKPKILELSYLYAQTLNDRLIEKNKYFIDDIEEVDIFDKPDKTIDGMTHRERRWKQIEKVKTNNRTFFLDKENLNKEMNTWSYPLHFIDFETSSPALPFTKDSHPYEGIAFQYSHHTVSLDPNGGYKVEHKSQYINIDQGVNPNIDFIRSLKKNLSEDNGTIFRYHNHENTYLRMIYNQIKKNDKISDKNELLEFIDSITQYKVDKERIHGNRNMVDMWSLVLRFYYSPHAQGSTSLKRILPAAINDSSFLKEKYSNPICGKEKEVSSQNFDSQVWISNQHGNDPYKMLPPIFEDFSREELDELFSDIDDDLADGGAAMMAYAKLQFFDTPEDQREAIKNALLKYCELDTLAMVMVWEFWYNEIAKNK